MASVSQLVQGTTIEVSTTAQTELAPSPFPTMQGLECLMREVTWTGGTSPEIDTTTICSTAKEFKLGLADPGSISFSGHWKQDDAGHIILKTADSSKDLYLFVVTFEDATTFTFLASVQQRSWGASVDGVVTASYTLRLSGPTAETES